MSLYEEVKKNKHLVYVDDEHNGIEYPFDKLPLFGIPVNNYKQLSFLYLDNSLNAITVFWSFMKSSHAIALLSPNISNTFKTDLERLYQPYFIYDSTRDIVENYDHLSYSGQISLHVCK